MMDGAMALDDEELDNTWNAMQCRSSIKGALLLLSLFILFLLLFFLVAGIGCLVESSDSQTVQGSASQMAVKFPGAQHPLLLQRLWVMSLMMIWMLFGAIASCHQCLQQNRNDGSCRMPLTVKMRTGISV